MKRFSSMWRQAARSLGFEKPASMKPKKRSDGIPSKATLGWITSQGVNFTPAQLLKSGNGRLVARVAQSLPVETSVRFASAAGGFYPGVTESCDADEARFLLSVRLNENHRSGDRKQPLLGRVRLKWVDEQDTVAEAKVSIESGSEGQIVATVGESLPVPSVVFLSGYEFVGLAAVTACEAAGEHYRLTLEMADELFTRGATAA